MTAPSSPKIRSPASPTALSGRAPKGLEIAPASPFSPSKLKVRTYKHELLSPSVWELARQTAKLLNSAEIVLLLVPLASPKKDQLQRATRPWHAGVGNHAGSNSAGVLTATSTPTARLSRPLRVQNASMGSTMRVDWLWSLHPVPVNADVQGFLSSQDADVERQVPLVWLWRLH